MFSEVSAIEARREHIKIITTSKKVMSLVSLSSIANYCHQSYIIKMRYM